MNTLIMQALKSKTIWGLIISALGATLSKTGVLTVTPDMQGVLVQEIMAIIPMLMEWGGYVFAAYGRVVATKPLIEG